MFQAARFILFLSIILDWKARTYTSNYVKFVVCSIALSGLLLKYVRGKFNRNELQHRNDMVASLGWTNFHLPTVIFELQHRLSAALTALLSHISQSNAQPYGKHYLHIDFGPTNISRSLLSQDNESSCCLKPHRIFLYARYSFSPEALLFLRPIFVPQVTFRQRKPLSYPSFYMKHVSEPQNSTRHDLAEIIKQYTIFLSARISSSKENITCLFTLRVARETLQAQSAEKNLINLTEEKH